MTKEASQPSGLFKTTMLYVSVSNFLANLHGNDGNNSCGFENGPQKLMVNWSDIIH